MRSPAPDETPVPLPLVVFLGFYVATFFLGAAMLLQGWVPFSRFYAETGIRSFWLDSHEVLADWLLAVLAPLLFGLGWRLASRGPAPVSREAGSLRLRPLVVLFAVLLAGAFASLAQAGMLTRLDTWADYGYFIQSRLLLFGRLTFAEWVNLYALLPASAALLALRLAQPPRSRARVAAVVAVVAAVLAVDVFLFQKRYALLAILFFAACAGVNSRSALVWRRATVLRVAGVGLAVYLAYCVLAVVSTTRRTPVIVQGETTALLDALRPPDGSDAEGRPAAGTGKKAGAEARRHRTYYSEVRWPALRSAIETLFPGRWIGTRGLRVPDESETFGVRFLRVALNPLLRLAPPALAYPALFPRVLGYFGLDVAADMAGFGRMPDDNLVVYGAMYGQLDKGAIAVPFQYSWFSQIGLFGALLLCLPLGAATCAAWRASLASAAFRESRVVLAALVVMFALHITQDSVRGALLNSYGVVWSVLLVLGVTAAAAPGFFRGMRKAE